MKRTIEIDLQYQNLIDGPPPTEGDLYKRACAGDSNTVSHWQETWIKNYKAAKDIFGSFHEHSYGQLHGIYRHKPCIVIGSGPSLKFHVEELKENAQREHPVPTISCLHNFGYFEDHGFHADYYLSLDSGKVVLDDVSEAMLDKPESYWNATKGKALIAYAASDPELFEKWQGDIYLFNCLIPSMEVRKAFNEVEKFTHYISSGGNALGACFYTAKALFGANPLMIVGGDFCFDYDDKFHAYNTKYDNVGSYVKWPDVYGIPRKTWQSYLNFKFWFDNRAMTIPGHYISCSEGIMGAYREGNIRQFRYMSLKDALVPYKSADELLLEERNEQGQPVGSKPFPLAEYWKNPAYEHDLTFF